VTVAAVVLAAGRGERLRPLTDTVPKPLLRVGDTSLLDLALRRVATVVAVTPDTVAVNAHWLADEIAAHVGTRVHLSREEPEALGTAGAIGRLRPWIAGRDVLVTNGDVWFDRDVDVTGLVAGYDGVRPRLLVVADADRPDFGGRWRFAGVSVLPWSWAQRLDPVPSGLYEQVWSRTEVDLVPIDAVFIDCGTPEDLALARRLAGG
jgi:bifunctional N-acetylglucosamine-1-phosphate-uridyltransferase/glucosamine-1-phosphate-acetyltransferase GlmU-like protein